MSTKLFIRRTPTEAIVPPNEKNCQILFTTLHMNELKNFVDVTMNLINELHTNLIVFYYRGIISTPNIFHEGLYLNLERKRLRNDR